MPTPNILGVATSIPKYAYTTDDAIVNLKKHLEGQPEKFQKKVIRIFKYAGVDKRHTVIPTDQVVDNLSFEEKNDIYKKEMIALSEDVFAKALERANLQPTDIDFLITASCTGYMIPSIDAFLINRFDMRRDVVRLPVTEMGCVAGVSTLIYANNFLKNNPGKKAAVITVETPATTFQWNDFSMTNMVSAAIFGDGGACAILGFDDEKGGPAILDTDMYHFYDEIDMMGFDLTNSGFRMVLDPQVPTKIEQHFDQIVLPFLERNDLALKDIDHLIFHPGGKKIINKVEALFADYGKKLDVTRRILREYGNMSSATVLYVLKEFMDQDIQSGDKGIMLSFGPGLTAQIILLGW